MKEKDFDKASQFPKESFRMTPPADGWSRLDAELEKKQAVMYRQKANRFKRLSILLALLLLSFVSYYYFSPSGLPSRQSASAVVSQKDISGRGTPASRTAAITASSSLNQPAKKNATTSNTYDSNRNDLSPERSMERVVSLKDIKKEKVREATIRTRRRMPPSGSLPFSANTPLTENAPASKLPERLIADSKPVPIESGLLNNGVSENNDNARVKVEDSSSDKTNATQENKSFSSNDESKKTTPVEKNSPVAALTAKDGTPDSTTAPVLSKNKENISRWAISLFFSPHYTRNRMINNNPAGVDYSARYQDREKSKFAFATGFLIRYNLTDHWSVSSGSIYSTIAYSITIPTIHARADASNDVHYYYPTSCGVIEMPDNYGGVPVHMGDSMLNVGCTQVVEFLNVPLIIRYELKKNRFSFFSEGGVSANFVILEQARITVANTETTVTNNINGLQNRNYGFLFGAGVEYYVWNGFGVFAEPTYKGSLTSLTKDFVVYCYPYSIGANMGVSLHF